MDHVTSIFNEFKMMINDRLLPIGFSLSREQLPEGFGSRYIEYQSGNVVFQWIWDGRDGLFRVVYCHNITEHSFPEWKCIVELPFDIHQKDVDIKEAIKSIEEPFSAFLSEFAGK
ncbi:hypothetical protein hrd7_33690 (plasmid) [Leptolinea sp. HRD-7]|nr:hypothetical protein hrd7_33690 [Leptolinea sp. HRD-7]